MASDRQYLNILWIMIHNGKNASTCGNGMANEAEHYAKYLFIIVTNGSSQ